MLKFSNLNSHKGRGATYRQQRHESNMRDIVSFEYIFNFALRAQSDSRTFNGIQLRFQ